MAGGIHVDKADHQRSFGHRFSKFRQSRKVAGDELRFEEKVSCGG